MQGGLRWQQQLQLLQLQGKHQQWIRFKFLGKQEDRNSQESNDMCELFTNQNGLGTSSGWYAGSKI